MKTAELKDELLDLWVAKADRLEITPDKATNYRPSEYKGAGVCVHGGSVVGTDYSPSTDWSQGGAIIERELIDSLYHHDAKVWQCTMFNRGNIQAFGKTKLIAAMRCYVASKFGEEVDDDQVGG